MDPTWTLELLSNRGLSTSILITILLGLWLMLFLTETLGWLFVGVVVPGYLASILVISPTSALAITVEAVLSLALARFVAYGLSQSGVWSPFFGRDRFFLIVLVSVLVRQLDQTLILPWLDLMFRGRGWSGLDLNDQFSSIGLVLVPLTANLFWKQSFGRGLVQFLVVLGGTYALLRGVLLPYTNLTSASMMLLYEDSALNFVANAKVYIVMITTALIASQVNLKYGWDFGGILIAALLALLWWTPLKVLTTLLEALVLYAMARALLCIPVIRQANLEGSRKLVAVFTLGFVLKCLIALAIGDAFVGLKVTELFAFGYLMSSILAVRMLSEGSALKVLGPVVLVSLVGLFASSLVGLELQGWADKVQQDRRSYVPTKVVSKRLLSSPSGVLAYASVALPEPVDPQDQDRYAQERVWRALGRYLSRGKDRDRLAIDVLAREARMIWSDLEVDDARGDQGVYLLHPGETATGSPRPGLVALVFSGPRQGPVLVAHGLARYPGLAQVAWQRCQSMKCSSLVLVQGRRDLPTANLESTQFASLRSARPLLHLAVDPQLALGESREVPAQTQLQDWALVPLSERLGFAKQDELLLLSPRGLVETWIGHAQGRAWDLRLRMVGGSMIRLLDRFATQKESATPEALDGMSDSELRLLQDRIVPSLLAAASGQGQSKLEVASALAKELELELIQLPDCGKRGCVALIGPQGAQAFVWVLRLGADNAIDLQVPRARFEPGTLGYAVHMWSAHAPRSLLVHTGARSIDPTGPSATRSVFHALHQGMDASTFDSGFDSGLAMDVDPGQNLFFSIRGGKGPLFAEAQDSSDSDRKDLVVGLGEPLRAGIGWDPRLAAWLSPVSGSGLHANRLVADDSEALYRYAGQQHLQLRYTRLIGYKAGAVLWLSPRVRAHYKAERVSNWLAMHRVFVADQDPSWIDEEAFLFGAGASALPLELPKELATQLGRVESVVASAHPQAFAELVTADSKGSDPRVALVRGERSGRLYFALTQACGRALVSLDRWSKGRIGLEPKAGFDASLFAQALASHPRSVWTHNCQKKGQP